MKSSKLIAFLVICFAGVITIQAKKYAVLVATTKSWLNYRHQATVLHAYQTLIANGFPKEEIITMMYDDIATNPKNPEQGIIRNHPKGKNVYENVKKDYTGEKVTAENFMAVLNGDPSKAQGPVIDGNSGDTLFVYIVGLGSVQYLTFPTGPGIAARKFVEVLEKLIDDKKFDKIFLNVETSFAASLFDGILSTDKRIFVSAATYHYEYPYAVYCFPENKQCYGSLYGVAWTQYSDRLRQLKSGKDATLFDQFQHVRTDVPFTHVAIFGDLTMGVTKLREFLGYKLVRKHQNNPKVGLATPDEVTHQTNKFFGILSEDQLNENENRHLIKETMKNIFDKLNSYGYENLDYENAEKNHHALSEQHSNLYEQVIQEFHEHCIDINENPFALREISKLIHLIVNDVSLNHQIQAMMESCTPQHKLIKNVH